MAGEVPGLMYGIGLNQAALPTGGGVQLGQTYKYTDPNGGFKELQIVKAGGNIAANDALKFSDSSFTVIPTAAVTDVVDGCNDVSSGTAGSGAAVANGNYFLMTIRGNVKPKVAAAQAAGALQATAVSGQLTAWAANPTRIKSLAASGAGGPTAGYLG